MLERSFSPSENHLNSSISLKKRRKSSFGKGQFMTLIDILKKELGTINWNSVTGFTHGQTQ